MINVKGEPDLVRDPYSKAILNTNTRALAEHRKRKQLAHESSQRLTSLEAEVQSLKHSMSNVERMLELLVSQQKDK
jgi:hypothetical protein